MGFLAVVDGKPQLFVLPTAGGQAMQVTKAPAGLQQYSLLPLDCGGFRWRGSAADERCEDVADQLSTFASCGSAVMDS